MATPKTPIPPAAEREAQADSATQPRTLFGAPAEDRSSRPGTVVWGGIAVLLLCLIAIGIFIRGHHPTPAAPPNTQFAADPYAGNLAFSELAMSQSTSLSGGTSTFLDGRVRNNGPATITAITMQVVFRNDVGLAPQVETLPLNLIRTHEPYIDTEPVSAEPLKPGVEAEFRLVFETIAPNWNQQMPAIVPIHVSQR